MLLVVYSTVVLESRSQKFMLIAQKDWLYTWHIVLYNMMSSVEEREDRLRRRKEHYKIRREKEIDETRCLYVKCK